MLASSRKPCGGGNVRGRMLRAAGMAAANRSTVGRDALIPPDPAVAQTFAGGMNPAPTNKFYVVGDRDGCGRALEQTPVGDDACTVPQTLRRRGRPGFESLRCGGRERPPYNANCGSGAKIGACGGGNARGRDESRPYE